MEWRDPYNSFNSWKGLLYSEWYRAIIKGDYRPPIEASVDPIHACNLSCAHCNASRYTSGSKVMSHEHILKLIRFFSEWGVKAVCFGGGGEPTMNPALHDAIVETRVANMEASLATNGTLLSGKLLSAVPLCRWVGISADAATSYTYKRLKNADLFSMLLRNIKAVVREVESADTNCDISYKFLISAINQDEIFEAAQLARDLGCRDFHARPMDFHHQGMADADTALAEVNIDHVNEQFEKCHELETDDFRVFTVIHKFNPDWTPRKQFSQCWAAPLAIQCCADGQVYFCVDQRHQPEYCLGSHYPDPGNIKQFWGGERHQQLVTGNTPARCTTRCTFGIYCEHCDRLFAPGNDDPMCWRFT